MPLNYQALWVVLRTMLTKEKAFAIVFFKKFREQNGAEIILLRKSRGATQAFSQHAFMKRRDFVTRRGVLHAADSL